MQFRRIYYRAVRYSNEEGLLTPAQYEHLIAPLRWNFRRLRGTTNDLNGLNVMKEIEGYVMSNLPKEGRLADIKDAVFQFVKDNWVDILKLILSIVVLLEPNPVNHPIGDLE